MSNQPQPGDRLGRYRILSHIATGGMGTVYKAMDEGLERLVALKVLAPDLASNPIILERFRREARHAARLTHRNIVTLYECGEAEGLHYLAMEYVKGTDLADFIAKRGRVKPDEARRIIIQAAKALDHAFQQGIIHRDIKPSNFLLTRQGDRALVKMTDLGLARMVNEEDFRVTRAGTTVGTVDYLSPEQARDSTLADVRSDIYSLGCTFYHMLTGEPPFAEGGLGERIYKHLAVDPIDVRDLNPDVSDGLWRVLKRMLAKTPEQRYQTPGELLQALKRLDQGGSADDTASSPTLPTAPPPAKAAVPPRSAKPAASPPPKRPPSNPTTPKPAPAETPPEPVQKDRPTTVPEMVPLPPIPDPLAVSPEQCAAAAGQYDRAVEVLRSGKQATYALQLLLTCCKLDPTHLRYRKALREAGRNAAKENRSGWLGGLSLGNFGNRGKFKAARKANDHRKVLEEGEELLARDPDDISVQTEMAESAEELGMLELAIWLLEYARAHARGKTVVDRQLAFLYEKARCFKHAIALWEDLRTANPRDHEPAFKINELSVNETLSRGNLKR